VEAGLSVSEDPAYVEARKLHAELLDQAQAMRNEIANLEEQREGLRKRLDRGAFLNKFLSFFQRLRPKSFSERRRNAPQASGIQNRRTCPAD